MILTSPAFHDSSFLPSRFARRGISGGANTSPPLRWADPPASTQAFALSCIDHHPIAHLWVHWLVCNLPADCRALGEGISPGKLPAGAIELFNSFGSQGYGGPQPPRGSGPHRYVFTLAALSAPVSSITSGSSRERFLALVTPLVLAESVLTGIFEQ